MANPFDQFDSAAPVPAAPGAAPAGVPQPVVVPPGQNADAVAGTAAPQGSGAEDPNNPFNSPSAALAAQPSRMSEDEFASALYDKLNAGESPSAILQWSKEVGREIIKDRNFFENIRIRDEALRNRRKGSYGGINQLKEGEYQPTDVLDAGGAFVRQAGNTVLFNFGDEISSALSAVPELLTGGDVEKAYRDRWNDLQTRNDLDWAIHPGMSTAGVAVGALGGARVTPSIMNAGKVRNAGLATRAAAGGAEGAAYGAAAATGEGTPDDRFANTGAGATVGGGIGAAFSPAIAAVERLSRPIVERMHPNEIKALARRLGYGSEQISAAEAELARQQGLGIRDSTLLDVIDEPGRSVVGSAGTHDAARAELQNVANARQTRLPERVAGAADEIVAPPASGELGLTDDVRSGIEAQRNAEIEAAMDAPIAEGMTLRQAPLPMTAEIADVLGTTNGQRAIRNVINSTADAAERQQYETLLSTARQRARSTNPGLSESAQQAAQGASLETMPMTVGMSERIGRELNRMGQESGNGSLFSFGRTVRGAAEQSPRYREIMDRYRQMSGYADAPGVGSGVKTVMDEAGNVSRVTDEGAGFLAEPASRFETRVDQLGTAPMVDAAGQPVVTGAGNTVSERDLARLGASEQVATRAGRGPSEARSVASQLYDSPEQRARSVALLGEAGADRLAGRMREEVERVFRASRQATKEAPAAERGMAAVESSVNALYTPGPISALRESARFLHRIGMTERDALWIVRNATDPTQTQAILNRLKKAGVDETRARAYTDQLRDAAVRYFTSTEEN